MIFYFDDKNHFTGTKLLLGIYIYNRIEYISLYYF